MSDRKYDFGAFTLADFNDDPAILKKFTNLKSLSTAPEFDRDFGDDLPDTLTTLRLGRDFKQKVVLKPGLTHFYTKGYFNHPVVLPESMEEFEFGYFYDQPTVIPANVKQAKFGGMFRQEFKPSESMTRLRLCESYRIPFFLSKIIAEKNIRLIRYKTYDSVRDQFVIGEH